LKRFFRPLLFASCVLMLATAIACGADEEIGSEAVFRAAPWTGPEEYSYRITTRGVEGEGECKLITTPESEPGRTRLERLCGRDQFRDDGVAVVLSDSLRPVSSSRTISDSEKQRSTTHSVAYGEIEAVFKTDDGTKVRTTTRELPEPDKQSPQPAWYDDEELFWLVRTLDLRAGYTSAFSYAINAGQPRILNTRVEVLEAEQVTVPAGTFETWRVRVQRGGSAKIIWVEQEGSRRVIRAQIEDARYEMK
jgi:Protein of unknown function (DUF3108)